MLAHTETMRLLYSSTMKSGIHDVESNNFELIYAQLPTNDSTPHSSCRSTAVVAYAAGRGLAWTAAKFSTVRL